MGEDCTCSTVTRRVNSVPSRRCSGKSSKDSLFSSFSSASACTRVSTSFSASSSATLCPKHCWQRPVLESAKLETSNNSEHAGALCVGVSWRKREKGRKRCYREKYGVTRGKYKLTPWVFGMGIKACICWDPGVCKKICLGMFAWMDICYTQG